MSNEQYEINVKGIHKVYVVFEDGGYYATCRIERRKGKTAVIVVEKIPWTRNTLKAEPRPQMTDLTPR